MAMQSKSNIDWSLFYGQSAVDQFTIPAYFSTTAQRIAGLQHYKGIVHIIQGRQDPMGEATVFEIRDLLPQSKVHFIEKCGHFPWLEQEVPATEFFNHLEEALN
jgi:proline iminopeptidase